jgi:hypothetical protein
MRPHNRLRPHRLHDPAAARPLVHLELGPCDPGVEFGGDEEQPPGARQPAMRDLASARPLVKRPQGDPAISRGLRRSQKWRPARRRCFLAGRDVHRPALPRPPAGQQTMHTSRHSARQARPATQCDGYRHRCGDRDLWSPTRWSHSGTAGSSVGRLAARIMRHRKARSAYAIRGFASEPSICVRLGLFRAPSSRIDTQMWTMRTVRTETPAVHGSTFRSRQSRCRLEVGPREFSTW